MRTVPSGLVSAAAQSARIVSSRLVARDNRLRFSNMNKSGSDGALYSNMKSYDAATKGSTIYRVANISNTLYYCYLSSPGGSWPGWTSTGRSLKANSRPGLYQNRVFYQESGGSVKYSDFSGSSLGGANTYTGFPIAGTLSIAPIGPTTCVMRDVPSPTGVWATVMVTYPAGYQWEGRLYGNTDLSLEFFDAETDENGWTYVFFSDNESKRMKYMRFLESYEPWSDVQDVIPMDVVDDLNQFAWGGVTRPGSIGSDEPWALTGDLWVGGALIRTDGGHMQMYSQGPPWTMGRDIFVGTDGTTDDNILAGGKMHFIGSKVYYIGPGFGYEADGVDFTGDTSPSLSIDDVHSVRFTSSQNDSAKIIADIPPSVSGSALRSGSDLIWYASVAQEGGSPQEVKMGTFNIDVVLDDQGESGEYKTIIGRSRSAKNLQMWKPDTSYDYWGADTKIASPALRSEVIRVDGHWEVVADKLTCTDMNPVSNLATQEKLGLMYSTARPSRGGIAQMKFKYDSDTNYNPIAGIAINYYVETKEQAAERAGVADPNTLSWLDYGRNYLLVAWGTKEHSGAPGVSLRAVRDGDWVTWPVLNTVSLALSAATDYWLMVRYQEGHIDVYYRADSASSWTKLFTESFEEEDKPYFRAQPVGRFGLFTHNEISWTYNRPHNNTATYLPFGWKVDQYSNALPVPEVYIVDEEQYYVTAIGGTASTARSAWINQECHLWPNDGQPKDNPGFTPPANSFPIWGEYVGGLGDTSANYYNDMMVVVLDGPAKGNTYEVAAGGWDYDAPRQWKPTGGYFSPTNPDWLDFVGNVSYGEWDTKNFSRIFVTEDTRGAFRPGTQWAIVYKGTCTRGYNSTLISSHNDLTEKLNLYTPGRVHIDEFNVFTNEKEWSMEEMIVEIARKAGVQNIEAKKHMDRTVTSSGSWNLGSQFGSYKIKQANCVVHMAMLGSSGKGGIQFGRTSSGSGGWVVYVQGGSNGHAVLMTADSQTVLQSVPLNNSTYATDGWMTFSVQEQRANVYLAGALVAAFKLPEEINTQSWAAPAYSGATVRYNWPELGQRVDNFIMDIGIKGSSSMNRLIGQKRIYWQDDQNGDLRLYREKVTVNSGDPYDLANAGGGEYNETNMATRVRVEGADAAMSIDEDALAEHGNLFFLANSEDVMTAQDAQVEADWLLDEVYKQSNSYNLSGACDPRVEAGDIIEVEFPDETVSIVVDRIAIAMEVSKTQAVFDMQIQGHDANT